MPPQPTSTTPPANPQPSPRHANTGLLDTRRFSGVATIREKMRPMWTYWAPPAVLASLAIISSVFPATGWLYPGLAVGLTLVGALSYLAYSSIIVRKFNRAIRQSPQPEAEICPACLFSRHGLAPQQSCPECGAAPAPAGSDASLLAMLNLCPALGVAEDASMCARIAVTAKQIMADQRRLHPGLGCVAEITALTAGLWIPIAVASQLACDPVTLALAGLTLILAVFAEFERRRCEKAVALALHRYEALR